MKAKQGLNPELKAEYDKQIRRIKRFIRSASKRGYDFPDYVVPKHPKVITEASIRKVKSITPEVLYKKATYIKNTGEKITGLEGRKHERRQAAIKAAETKATKAGKTYEPPTVRSAYTPRMTPRKSPQNSTAKSQQNSTTKRKRNKPSQGFYKRSKKYKKGDSNNPPDASTIIIENLFATLETLENLISSWSPQSHWTTALTIIKTRDKNVAKNILLNAIAELGRETVAKNCENAAKEIIPLLEEILYASGSKEGNFKDGRTQVNFDIVYFQSLLLGRPVTPEENIELVDFMESALYEDADEETEQFMGNASHSLAKTETTYDTEYDEPPYKFKD